MHVGLNIAYPIEGMKISAFLSCTLSGMFITLSLNKICDFGCRLSSQDPSEKLQFLHKWVLAHTQHSAEILNQPVIFTEFGLSDQKSGFSIQLRNEFNNIVYDQVYSSVLEGGAAGGALFWQFLHEEMADWNDGFGIFPTEPCSTTELIAAQSARLKSASGAHSTCPVIETTNTEEEHEHNITRILKRLHLWK